MAITIILVLGYILVALGVAIETFESASRGELTKRAALALTIFWLPLLLITFGSEIAE
jgi:uncharacterized membrane protein